LRLGASCSVGLLLCAFWVGCGSDEGPTKLVDLSAEELDALCDANRADYENDAELRMGVCNRLAGVEGFNIPGPQADRIAACEAAKQSCTLPATTSASCSSRLVPSVCDATVADFHTCHEAALAQEREHARFSCEDELRWWSRVLDLPPQPSAEACQRVRICLNSVALDGGVIQLPP
jgi:hypothetical protein